MVDSLCELLCIWLSPWWPAGSEGSVSSRHCWYWSTKSSISKPVRRPVVSVQEPAVCVFWGNTQNIKSKHLFEDIHYLVWFISTSSPQWGWLKENGEQVPFIMTIENVEFTHEFLPKQLRKGTERFKWGKETANNRSSRDWKKEEVQSARKNSWWLNYRLGLLWE